VNRTARSILIKLVVVVLLGYAAYTAWLGVKHESAWFLLWAVPSVAGGIGLAMSRSWSQYLVYLVAFCTVAGWAAFVALFWSGASGEFLFKLFALGAGLIVISLGSSVLVFQHFRRNATQI
jgi:hypothetical protein